MKNSQWSDYLLAHPEELEGQTLISLFRKVVNFQPDQIAVVSDVRRVTYKELDAMSDKIAWRLVEKDVHPGDAVGVMAGRSIETVLGILGAWKAGCAYVFLDREYPAQRNVECMQECGSRGILSLDWIQEALEYSRDDPFADRGSPDSLAAVVYTSGSTSRPKGVLLTQANILASIRSFRDLGITSQDHYCSFASMMFVASVYDIGVSLCTGASLYLIPKEIRRSIRDVARYYRDNGITVTFLPPHMAHKYEEFNQDSPLRVLICGSEPARNLKPCSYRIAHVYASTEACAIISIYWIDKKAESYPAGKLVNGLHAYIVDENGHPVKRGETGELWLSGPQIARGYLGLPLETHNSFALNPFGHERKYEFVYKTRDLMSLDEEGNLVFHGRIDNMVKVRGFRIELAAVENCMIRFPGIQEVCCRVFTDRGGENILMGYYTARPDIDHEQLRTFMARNLPYYMIPTGLIHLDEMPRSRNNKIDRNALPVPQDLDDHKKLARLYH